ncbi:MAG: hypothetical protein ABL928_09505, partial [Sphingorhabdus sp.]
MRIKSIQIIALLATAMTPLSLSSAAHAQAQANSNSNQFWWPEKLDVSPLRQHAPQSNPMGDDFD